jgi:hypothetical protein
MRINQETLYQVYGRHLFSRRSGQATDVDLDLLAPLVSVPPVLWNPGAERPVGGFPDIEQGRLAIDVMRPVNRVDPVVSER